jgi:tetratricopeptide (TPR) repeat protein
MMANRQSQKPTGSLSVQPPAAAEGVPAAKAEAPVPPISAPSSPASLKPAIKIVEPVMKTVDTVKNDTTPPQVPKNTARQDSKKDPLSEKMKTLSGIDGTSKNGKDVALYTAKTYEEEKNYNQAIEYYKKALEKDPRNYLIMNKLSSVLITTGSFKESIQYSMNVLTIQKNYVPALINLSIANIQLGNMAEGELYLVKAKSLEASNKAVLFNLGLLYEKIAKYAEALPLFQRLADMHEIQGNLGMARILEKQGKRTEAEKIYKEILRKDNADPVIKQMANERIKMIGDR